MGQIWTMKRYMLLNAYAEFLQTDHDRNSISDDDLSSICKIVTLECDKVFLLAMLGTTRVLNVLTTVLRYRRILITAS